MAHAQPESDLLDIMIQGYFRDFPFVHHAIAVKIDYPGNVDPLSPAERTQQQVRVWHFIRNPTGPAGLPLGIPAPLPVGLPPYPWEMWTAPGPGQYVISLPTSSLADPGPDPASAAPLPAAAVGKNCTLDMFEIYQYLQEEGYLP